MAQWKESKSKIKYEQSTWLAQDMRDAGLDPDYGLPFDEKGNMDMGPSESEVPAEQKFLAPVGCKPSPKVRGGNIPLMGPNNIP